MRDRSTFDCGLALSPSPSARPDACGHRGTRPRRLASIALLVACALAPHLARASATDPTPTGAPPLPIRYRSSAVVIQLRAEATRLAQGKLPGIDILATPEAFGLHDLDRVGAAFGGVRLEPEFARPTRTSIDAHDDELDAYFIAHLPAGVDLERALTALRGAREVERAEPIAIVPIQAVPNDSLWDRAYYFHQASRRDLHGPEAWDLEQGDTSIVLAILDTGVLLHHPDLRDQIWINWHERGGIPGFDDDGNGYIDDDRGWDFVALDSAGQAVIGEDWRDADNDPDDLVAHGTAVAGVAAGRTNNTIGIASTAWGVRIMPLRVGWSSSRSPSGEIDLSWVAQAIVYAARNGATAVNCSFTSIAQPDLAAAAAAALRAGVTVVAAAGNGQPEHYLPDRDEVVAVAASDANDQIAGFSNRGRYVDLAAPGVSISVTSITRPGTDSLGRRQPTYAVTASGTSFAAPFVTGAVGLLQSYRLHRGLPPLGPIEVQLRLTETADDIAAQNPGLTGYGSGRLDLLRMLTDPPGSFLIRAPGRTVGPPLVLPTLSGRSRLAFAMSDGHLVMTEARSGASVRSIPLGAPPLGGLAAADLGGGLGIGIFVATTDGRIAGFDEGGVALPGWPVTAAGFRSTATTEPQLGDLDGDGTLEVVWGGADGSLWAWHADGSRVPGFPRQVDVGSSLRLALSDLDGRPGVEIVAVSIAGLIYALRGNGQMLSGWPVLVEANPIQPIVVRLGTNPEPAVILVSQDGLLALRPNGRLRWWVPLPGNVTQPLAAGDLDGDGRDEIVISVSTQIAVVDSGGRIATLRDLHQSLAGTGGPLIGSLAAGGGAGILEYVQPGSLMAFDAAGNAIGPFPKPGGAGSNAAIADVDGDGRTDVVAGSGRDSAIYVYVAGPATWNATAQSWTTRGGNYARTGSRLYAPPLVIADDLPPAAVVDLAPLEVGAHSVELRWTAPTDAGPGGRAVRYDLRRSTSIIDETNFDLAEPIAGLPEPGVAGAEEHVVVSGLQEGIHHHFALRSIDRGGNSSPISNRIEVTTPSLRPGPVRNLRVAAASITSLSLVWTATGDDGAVGRPARYLIRAAEHPLDDSSFAAAPIAIDVPATADAGGSESFTVGDVTQDHRYWVALRAEDASGNVSALSNVVSSWIGPLAARDGIALAIGEQPTRAPVTLYWQGAATSSAIQSLRIYDLAGRIVRTFTIGSGTEGIVQWDGRDDDGHRLGSGLYFARFTSGAGSTRARIVLVE